MNLQAPPGYVLQREAERVWCSPPSLVPLLESLMRTPLAGLREDPAAVIAGTGRSGPFHIPVPGADSRVLIRPYARGGLLARWLPRGFRDLSRGFAELAVSARAQELGLPVAGPVALSGERSRSGRWEMAAWSWWIPGAPSLVAQLKAAVGRTALLDAVAETLRRCHDAGLLHRDLNAHNVIARGDPASPAALLVDLDRAEFLKEIPEKTRLAQLRRLYRSLAKTGVIPAIVADGEYARLVAGYFGKDLDAGRLARFMRSCRRQAFWHSFLWR